MKFLGTLLLVGDKKAAAAFYEELLGETLLFDNGVYRAYKSGVSLQLKTPFSGTNSKPGGQKAGGDTYLCYETEEFERFLKKLQDDPLSVPVAPGHAQPGQYEWGQRFLHLQDPDNRIVEVRESMRDVICRFSAQGLTVEDIVMSTGMPEQRVKEYLGIL
jgi:catechol 2,3-dioxygenase-like lactoylglutathione lyase family enzyme